MKEPKNKSEAEFLADQINSKGFEDLKDKLHESYTDVINSIPPIQMIIGADTIYVPGVDCMLMLRHLFDELFEGKGREVFAAWCVTINKAGDATIGTDEFFNELLKGYEQLRNDLPVLMIPLMNHCGPHLMKALPHGRKIIEQIKGRLEEKDIQGNEPDGMTTFPA